MSILNIDTLNWNKADGLLPAIVQHSMSGRVLMLGYMNREALEQTLETERVTFFSRSKQRLWVKGETSGNYLHLSKVVPDCDQDALLVQVYPLGNTCHLDKESCFGEYVLSSTGQVLYELEKVICERGILASESSYTFSLLEQGVKKVAQKLGEEAVETAIAALVEDDEALCNEGADLMYHFLVLLQARKLSFSKVIAVLDSRM